jgi:uncharacterized protein (TIGR02246 family)
MTKIFLATSAALAWLSIWPIHATAADKTTDADAAIRRLADEFVAAFDRGDAKAVAAHWASDGEYEIGGRSIKGRDAIAKVYEEFFKSHPVSKMRVRVDSVRLLAPTVAVEEGTASVGGSPGIRPTASAYTAIHVKQNDGRWLMAAVREAEVPMRVREDLQELAWLVGNWAAQGDEANVEISYEWIANKNFLRGETKVRAKADGQEAIGGTQIIGRDPISGQIVTWFFNADGGHGTGAWTNDGSNWIVESQGVTAGGEPTTAVNVLHKADDNVMSWQSVNRTVGGQMVPKTGEIVLDRVAPGTTAKK